MGRRAARSPTPASLAGAVPGSTRPEGSEAQAVPPESSAVSPQGQAEGGGRRLLPGPSGSAADAHLCFFRF